MLVDGWYAYARKPHYTADVVQALCWGLACGTEALLPYWYVGFFLPMIIHRARPPCGFLDARRDGKESPRRASRVRPQALRDDSRCSSKYGDDWARYTKRVPYVFIPGLV